MSPSRRGCSTSTAGRDVTASFGVAASAAGQAFEYADTFRRADAAPYGAKRAGRNRVAVDGSAALEELVA